MEHTEPARLPPPSVVRLLTDPERLVTPAASAQVQSFIADRAEFWWDVKRPAAPVLCDSTIRLGEELFNEIIAHPIPFDLHTLRALKRSSLGLDLYFWLVYRTFALKRPLCLSWKQLYSQFGADPAKSSENTTVQHFRKDCIRGAERPQEPRPPG